jgi:phosphate-selective porin OprO and OprP
MKSANMNRTLAAVSVIALAASAFPALASDTAAEIRLLKEQLKRLEARVAKQDREQRETNAQVRHATNVVNAAVAKGPATPAPPPVFVSFKNGLFVETEDHAYSFKLGGRIHVDGGGSSQPETGKAGNAGLRRAQLQVDGKFANYYFYKLQYEFAMNNTTTTIGGTSTPLGGMLDAYMGIQHPALSVPFAKDPLYVMIGHQYEPANLERLISSNYIDFIERSIATDGFTPNRHIGIAIGGYGDNWSAKGGVFSTSPQDKALAPAANFNYDPWQILPKVGTGYPVTGGGQYFDIAGRATYAPIMDDERLLHLGAWGRYHQPNDSIAGNDDRVLTPGANLKTEANILNENLVGAPDLSCGAVALYGGGAVAGKCVKDVVEYGAELVGSYGPVSVQAEYSGAHYDRNPNALALASAYTSLNSNIGLIQPQVTAANFDGYYVYGTWYLTGESRAEAYNVKDKNSASFQQIKIRHPLSAGGWGAWELGLRFSSVDFNSGPITGSTYQNLVSLGVLKGNTALVRAVTNSSVVGGREQDLTAGINWYPEKGFRVMANWVRVMELSAPYDRPYLNGAHPNLFMVRTQVDW